jgi:hypothetical protein
MERVELEKRKKELLKLDGELRKIAAASQSAGPRKVVLHGEKSSVEKEREVGLYTLSSVVQLCKLSSAEQVEFSGTS